MKDKNLNKIKKLGSSNRSFGILFFIVFFIIGLWPLLNFGEIRIWSIIISFVFLLLGLLNSKILTPMNKLWIKFGELLGRIVSPIVMFILYFAVVTPIGIIMRVFFRKDLLSTKFSKKSSYWINREKVV